MRTLPVDYAEVYPPDCTPRWSETLGILTADSAFNVMATDSVSPVFRVTR